jgi:hypothetical protein
LNTQASRNVLDTIIQNSTVELFRSGGLAVSPIARSNRAPSDLSGCAGASLRFAGPLFEGELTLWIPEEVLELVPLRESDATSSADGTCELVHQLEGRIRNRLSAFQIEWTSSLPVALNPSVPGHEPWDSQPLGVYGFRTRRGVITVILTGVLQRASLTYSRTSEPDAGDIIF